MQMIDKVLLAVQQLRGPALAWWQSYREINENANEIVWADFVKIFREHHIPSSVMKLKRDEFRKLRQGDMTVTEYLHKFTELSRYAPEDINDDEKKQEDSIASKIPRSPTRETENPTPVEPMSL